MKILFCFRWAMLCPSFWIPHSVIMGSISESSNPYFFGLWGYPFFISYLKFIFMVIHALFPLPTQDSHPHCSLYMSVYLQMARFFTEGKTMSFYWWWPNFFWIKAHCISCPLGLPAACLSDSPLWFLCVIISDISEISYLRYDRYWFM